MAKTTCTDANGACIYPMGAHRSCLLCGQRKPFDPADYTAPWPSWDGLKPGDTIRVDCGNTDRWPAVVLSTHRGGAKVEVTPPDGAGVDPWTQYVMQGENGVYAR